MAYHRILLDDHFLPGLMSLIASAELEVLISSFKIQMSLRPEARKLMSIYKGLERAKNKGVSVKILTNLHAGGNLAAHVNSVTARNLRERGIEVRGYPRSRIIHAKICVVDSEAFILGSHNFTTKALISNYEASILIKDKKTASLLRDSFYRLWNLSSP